MAETCPSRKAALTSFVCFRVWVDREFAKDYDLPVFVCLFRNGLFDAMKEREDKGIKIEDLKASHIDTDISAAQTLLVPVTLALAAAAGLLFD